MKKLLLLIPIIVFTILSVRFIQAQPRSPGSQYVDVSVAGFNIISRQTSDLVVTQIVQSMVTGGVASNVIKNAAGGGVVIVTNSATLNTFYLDTNIVQAIDKEQAAGGGIVIVTNGATLNTIYLDTNAVSAFTKPTFNTNQFTIAAGMTSIVDQVKLSNIWVASTIRLVSVNESTRTLFSLYPEGRILITGESPTWGANLSIGPTGMTASAFSGSGSNLTELNGTNIQLATINSNKMDAATYQAFMFSGNGIASATNAIVTISTNGTLINPSIVTNLNFIGGGIQITGNVSGSTVNLGFNANTNFGGAGITNIYGTNTVLYTNVVTSAVSNTLVVYSGPAGYQLWQVNGNAAVTNTSGYGRTTLVVSNSVSTNVTFSFPSTWRKIGSVTTNSAVLASGKMLQADIDVFPWATTYACAIEP